LRFFSRRNILIAFGFLIVVIAATVGAIVSYLKSPEFEARAREYIIREIEARTGTKVTLKTLYWSFWEQRFRIEDLTLRGLEPEHQAPLAHFGRIDIGINLRTLLQRRIDLFELTFTRPGFHLLVTPDGKTNIPSPGAQPQGKPFDFQVSIENFNVLDGSALLNERRLNLDLSLQNLAALLKYHDQREVLEAHLRYDGVVDRAPDVRLAFPYTLSADMDYTRATIVAHRVNISSGRKRNQASGKNQSSPELGYRRQAGLCRPCSSPLSQLLFRSGKVRRQCSGKRLPGVLQWAVFHQGERRIRRAGLRRLARRKDQRRVCVSISRSAADSEKSEEFFHGRICFRRGRR
jgi:uncharacterized protein involved in outer membrane biogenesis